MHWMIVIVALWAFGVTHVAAADSTSTGTRKAEDSRGITVDDLGEG